MSLKPCRECKKLVSTDTSKCPQCGAKRPTTTKKNLWAIAFGLIILSAFYIFLASGQNESSNSSEPIKGIPQDADAVLTSPEQQTRSDPITPSNDHLALEQNYQKNSNITQGYRLINDGYLNKGVPYCQTDDLLAKFGMTGSNVRDMYSYRASKERNPTAIAFIKDGECGVIMDKTPARILVNDKGKLFACDRGTCEAGGHLIFVRITMKDGQTKDVWVTEGTIELQAISVLQNVIFPKNIPMCPTLESTTANPVRFLHSFTASMSNL
jgi:hypothetical protein